MLKKSNLVGESDSHIVSSANGVRLQGEALEAFAELQEQARSRGFDLRAASSFRNQARQLAIWNKKARGELPVLSSEGVEVSLGGLSEKERVFAILRWSALPGASRHHWGTEVDVYDAGALNAGEQLKLTPEETEFGGPFYPMYQWLEPYLHASGCCFFRPYAVDLGGVAPEPWHLSYEPLAGQAQAALSEALLVQSISSLDIELGETVLAHMSEIYQRFVINVCSR